ncbi:MAG: class I SAM-dependent methyltransferase [Nitrospirota bacterium]
MTRCLICDAPIEPFISFGRMPIANGFLSRDRFADEYFFELKAAFCPRCGMVQLVEQPEPGRMFHENYAFFSGTSARMAAHFKQFAEGMKTEHLQSEDPFVVEIGSNDGIMLKHFKQAGIRHVGIEPSANVAQVARENGIQTICEFFDEALARRIVEEHGPADLFLGANVMCHIPNLHSIVAGIKQLLKPRGVVVFEDPYLGDVIEKTSYDQIYDEHAFLFSVSSISYLFEQHGMEVVDVEPQGTHGGSMRYTLARRGMRPVTPAVAALRAREEMLGLNRPETYDRLRGNIERSRDALMALLRECKRQGKRVAGYAATSKSTTVINYCGITTELIEYISDTTPIKQGKYSPGAHIPIRPYEEFKASYPDYALLFGWNHAEEIMANERKFKEAGGRFIVYVPKVQVLE